MKEILIIEKYLRLFYLENIRNDKELSRTLSVKGIHLLQVSAQAHKGSLFLDTDPKS